MGAERVLRAALTRFGAARLGAFLTPPSCSTRSEVRVDEAARPERHEDQQEHDHEAIREASQ